MKRYQSLVAIPLAILSIFLIVSNGCGTGPSKAQQDREFFTSGSKEADQRAQQRMAKSHDLKPQTASGLLGPTTMNAKLRLDPEAAEAASPLFWPPPPPGRTLVTAVGEHETPEFHRQSRAIVERWARAGVVTEYLSVAGVHHFTIVDELTRPGSALFDRVVALARSPCIPEEL